MKRTALKIAYIGTHFHGFQRQPDVRTVEEELIYHLRKLGYIDDLKASRFRIAGRTDAGVHSLGQTANFKIEGNFPIEKIPIALNSKLKNSIRIKSAEEVEERFHSRYSVKSKRYRYIINNSQYGTEGGNVTYDKIFLLSLEEAGKYLTDAESGKITPTPFAFRSGINYNPNKEASWWWLRTMGKENNMAAVVSQDGEINPEGELVSVASGAVRPAIWVRVD